MSRMPGSLIAPAFGLVIALSISSCHSWGPQKPGDHPGQPPPPDTTHKSILIFFDPYLMGKGWFWRTHFNEDSQRHASMVFRGSTGNLDPQLGTITDIKIYGASGLPTEDDITKDAEGNPINPLKTIHNPTAGWGTGKFSVSNWDGSMEYTALVRFVVHPIVGNDFFIDKPWIFQPIHVGLESGQFGVAWDTPEGGGSGIYQAMAMGVFQNTGIALYDVSFDTTRRTDTIEIWAAPYATLPFPDPANEATQLLERDTVDHVAGHWSRTGLSGNWTGSDHYKILIRVYYKTAPVGPEDFLGQFENITATEPQSP